MSYPFEHILFQEAWSEADREALRAACDADTQLARQIRTWAEASRAVSAHFREALPESRLLVLYALSQSDLRATLSEEELEAGQALHRQIETSPSRDTIRLILSRIQQEATAFDRAWRTAEAPERAPVVRRLDRPALRRLLLPRPVVRWGYAVAAALAITVIAVTVFRLPDAEPDMLVYRAAAGQTQIVNLPDGSSVRLVDGSELRYKAESDAFDREVLLQGKAYFDVASDGVRFHVSTPNAVVSVYGTSFGVTSDERGSLTEVVLVSGSVQLRSLADESASVMLEPGQTSRVVGNGAPLEPSAVNVDRALAWTDLFIFRETQLREAAERLSESFNVPVIVSEEIEKRTVTGTFSRDQGLRPILDAVATALSVSILELPEPGGYRLAP